MKRTYIYALRDPRDGEIRYIGKANDPSERLKMHTLQAKRPTSPVQRWVSDLSVDGLLPIVEVLEQVEWTAWPEAEKRWIAEYREQIVNVQKGGGSLVTKERTVQLFTRVSPEQAIQLEALAEKSRMNLSDYLRWLVEDAVSGKYVPSHLK